MLKIHLFPATPFDAEQIINYNLFQNLNFYVQNLWKDKTDKELCQKRDYLSGK